MSESGIYGLTDEDAGEVRYVGRAFDIERRYVQHIREGASAARASMGRGWIEAPILRSKLNWLAYMQLEGKPVGVALLEPVKPDVEAQAEREHAWAHYLSTVGFPLANGTTAGTHLGGYMSKGACPYTLGLPVKNARSIEPPDGLLRLRPGYPVIPIRELHTLRKLRADAPELHAAVLAGNLTAHGAMVQAGFRPRTFTLRPEPTSAARTLRKYMKPDQLRELARLLVEEDQ